MYADIKTVIHTIKRCVGRLVSTRLLSIQLAIIVALAVNVGVHTQEYQELILQHSDLSVGIEVVDRSGFEFLRYPGMAIRPGDTLATTGTRTEIGYNNIFGVMRLGEDATIRVLAPLDTSSNLLEPTQIELVEGEARLTLARDSQPLKIHTELTEITSSGVDLVVDYRPRLRHTVEVYGGTATITNKLTEETVIVANGCRYNFYGLEDYLNPIEEIGVASSGISCALPSVPDTFTTIFSEEIADNMRIVSEDEQAILDTLIDVSGEEGELAQATEDSIEDEDAAAAAAAAAAAEAAAAKAAAEEAAAAHAAERTDTFFYVGGEAALMSYEERAAAITGAIFGFESPFFGVGIAVPLHYAINPFDPATWYNYRGSHNWSFGGGLDPIGDVARDILTKIEYLHFNIPDNILVGQIGSIQDVTFGRGALLRNYSNALDLPLQYNVGLFTQFKVPLLEITFFTDDLSRARFFGSRFELQLGILGVGLEFISDWGINEVLTGGGQTVIGTDLAALTVLSSDIYFGENTDTDTFLGWHAVLALFLANKTGSFQFNFASLNRHDGIPFINNILLGVGNVTAIGTGAVNFGLYGWAGIAEPLIFTREYERRRFEIAQRVSTVLNDPGNNDIEEFHIALYAGIEFDIVEEILELELGYLFPTRLSLPIAPLSTKDYFNASLKLDIDLLEGFTVDVGVSRKGFMNTILSRFSYTGASLFDANSSIHIGSTLQIEDFLTLGVLFSSSTVRQASGEPRYTNGVPQTAFVFNFSVRFHPRFYLPNSIEDTAPDTVTEADTVTETPIIEDN